MNLDQMQESPTVFHAEKQGAGMRVLVVTAVSAEKEAVLRGIGDTANFRVLAAGVGPVAAAIGTATALATDKYDLVIAAGIAGGFKGRAELGSLVVADEIVAADLGAQSPEGFLSLDELGFGSTRFRADGDWMRRVVEALHKAGLPATTGAVLTVSTVTGTAETAAELVARVPGATAEGMEGFGVAAAASRCGVPILELRAISNPVGPRDRDAWRISEALEALAAASSVLREVLT
jgi:futalosine hydrolase